MNEDRFNDLLAKHSAGALTQSEARELLAELESAPGMLEEFRKLHRMDQMLTALGTRGIDVDELMRALPEQAGESVADQVLQDTERREPDPLKEIRRSRLRGTGRRTGWPRFVLIPLGTAAALLIAWYIARLHTPATQGQHLVASVAGIDGAATLVRGGSSTPVAAGTSVAPGDQISTGPASAVTLRYPDRSTLRVSGPARVAFVSKPRKCVRLEQGNVHAAIAPQPRHSPMTLVTPHANVTVVGTRFTLSVDTNATRLDMNAGRVRMTRLSDGKTIDVDGGFRAVAGNGIRFASMPRSSAPYHNWPNGPGTDSAYFPIGVWTQDPQFAARYREAGINVYLSLWKGPTEEQLAALRRAGMQTICDMNRVGRRCLGDKTIIGWISSHEPDNAQRLGNGKGYGPPVKPETVIARYDAVRRADPTRPCMLVLGQGVAWNKWYGRGVRTDHPEDYREYVKGCDLVSFDIYPVVHDRPEVRGKLWYVAQGVERLRKWTEDRKVVWNIIECSRIRSNTKPTPEQVRTEVWMSLIHGSMGIVYFVHEWTPELNDHALLDDARMLSAVTAVNSQIKTLSPVLNTPTIENGAGVESDNMDAPVACMVKRHNGSLYLFAVGMRPHATRATFTVWDLPEKTTAEVLGENRTFSIAKGTFTDKFEPYAVHLYRIREQ